MRYVKRPFRHPSRAKIRAYLADRYGVTEAHLLDIIAKRKAYRLARMHRQRSRRRTVEGQGARKSGRRIMSPGLPYSGEGELHALLHVVGLTDAEFYRLAGIPRQTFNSWYGHPLHAMPIELLRYYAWSKNMAEFLRSIGHDPEKFKPQLPTKVRQQGRYPRKKGDVVINKEDYSPWNTIIRKE